ncbi:MAG: glycosyltransferase [Thermoleophilaceae bacterium]
MDAPGRAMRSSHLAEVPSAPLRVVDVALFYGERSGGIRTYLDAKAAYAAESGAFEHHAIVPGRRERHDGTRHELRALTVAASNGYRLPLGTSQLEETLRAIGPDVILVHDPYWALGPATRVGGEAGVPVVAVHHSSVEMDAKALRGPTPLYRRVFRARYRSAYQRVDAVMSVIDPAPDSGRGATLPLRFGIDPAFAPRPGQSRGEHVLYVGRLARVKGVFTLLEAAAIGDWELRLIGSGPAHDAILSTAKRWGMRERVSVLPFVGSRPKLAAAYAGASCVVMPGPFETFGLVALEAAASGARVVACDSAPSAPLIGELAETFRPGDADDLARAIRRARNAPTDVRASARLGERFSWPNAFESELRDLRRLLR